MIRQYYPCNGYGSPLMVEFVGELQANNSQLHMSNARLQATQGRGQAREQQLAGLTGSKAHIGVLQRELGLIRGMNSNLKAVEEGSSKKRHRQG